MPYRQLPNTDPRRTTALGALFTKAAATTDANLPFPVALREQINTFRPLWQAEVGQATTALSQQTERTDATTPLAAAFDQIFSHFIQVFHFAVQRGVFERTDRVYYGLNANQSDVPPMHSHADRVLWAGRIAAGEAQRLVDKPAQPAMSLPSASQVAAAFAAYTAAHNLQSAAKEAYDDEQEDVAGLRPQADALILEAWDQIEFTHRRLDGPGRRRKAREWGIVYISRPGETPDPGGGGGEESPAVPTLSADFDPALHPDATTETAPSNTVSQNV